MENPEGTVKEYPKLPQNRSPEEVVKDYKNKNSHALGLYGQKIVDKRFYNLLKAGIIILAIAVGIFGLLAYNGNIGKDLICEADNITCEAQICNCPACPTNTCNPSLSCGNVTIPDEIKVKLNSS